MPAVASAPARKFAVTPPGILSYPALFTPRAPMPGSTQTDPRFQASLILSPETFKTPSFRELVALIESAAREKFGAKIAMNALRLPLRKCAEKESMAAVDPNGAFFACWSKTRPQVIGPDFAPIADPAAVWAGQTVRLSVQPFAYEQSGNRGVSLGLRNVQILRTDGPRLDGRASAEADFENVPLPEGFAAANMDDLPF
jgi:hypothetical protein